MCPFVALLCSFVYICCMSDESNLTTADVATRFGVKEQTVRRWRHKGTGPAFHKIGGRVIYVKADIDRYWDENRVPKDPKCTTSK